MAAGEERRKSAFVLARIRRVQRRLNLQTSLAAAVAPAWVAVTLLAVWRFVVQRHVPLFAGALALGAAVVWRLLTRRQGVSLEQAAVIADRRAQAGGLLLTRLETGVGEWELGLNDRVRALTAPSIRVRGALAGLSLAVLFLVVALVVPLPPKVASNVNAAAATKLDEVEAKLEAVAKEEPLDDAVNAELERLREELADNAFDAADWEAADTLDKELDRKAQEAAAELSRAEEAAKELSEAMASAQSADAANREKEELESALMQLSDGQAADAEQAMSQALGEQKPTASGENGKQGKPGPSQAKLSELRQALQNRQQQLQKSYSEQSKSQQHEASRPSSGRTEGEGKGEGKGEGEGKRSGHKGDGREHASRQVEGGPSHGGAEDTDLVFAGQAEMDPDRLKFEALPRGHGGDEPGELWGLKAADPKKPTASAAASGSGKSATGEQAPGNREGLLLPRNRALIHSYFDTPGAKHE